MHQAKDQTGNTLQSRAVRIASLATGRRLRKAEGRLLTRLIALINLACRRFAHAILLTRGSFTAFLGSHRSTGTRLLRGLAKARVCSHVSDRVCLHDGATSTRLGRLGDGTALVRLLSRRRVALLQARGRDLAGLHRRKDGTLVSLGTRLSILRALGLRRRRHSGGIRSVQLSRRGDGGLQRRCAHRSSSLVHFEKRYRTIRPSLDQTHRLSIRVRSLIDRSGRMRRVLRNTRGTTGTRTGGLRSIRKTLRASYRSLGGLAKRVRLPIARRAKLFLRSIQGELGRRRSRLTVLRRGGRTHIGHLGTFKVRTIASRRTQ